MVYSKKISINCMNLLQACNVVVFLKHTSWRISLIVKSKFFIYCKHSFHKISSFHLHKMLSIHLVFITVYKPKPVIKLIIYIFKIQYFLCNKNYSLHTYPIYHVYSCISECSSLQIMKEWQISLVNLQTSFHLTGRNGMKTGTPLTAVSYTHLDVYKRQVYSNED